MEAWKCNTPTQVVVDDRRSQIRIEPFEQLEVAAFAECPDQRQSWSMQKAYVLVRERIHAATRPDCRRRS